LLAAQFIQIDRTHPPIEETSGIPASVSAVLRHSCYDCHSNETQWPWYSYVAPVSWMLSHHVHEGRDHLNFSAWNGLSTEQQSLIASEVWEEVSEGEMPPRSYLLLHPNAKLGAAEMEQLRNWSM